MTVVLIPLKLIPISPCFDYDNKNTYPTAAPDSREPAVQHGAYGTALLYSALRPEWSIIILT